MTLIEFLLARIVEHERWAQAIQATIDADSGASASIVKDHPELTAGDCPSFIAEFDPARVLAECEAKRRIVNLWAEEWPEWQGPGSGITRTRMTDDQFARVRNAEYVLGCLALPYADHPDYRDEWRP